MSRKPGAPYAPQPGTFAARVIAWLTHLGPEQERTNVQIGDALGQEAKQVTAMLAPARDAGALRARRCRETGRTLWRIGDGTPPDRPGRDEGEEDHAAEALAIVQRTVQWPPRAGVKPTPPTRDPGATPPADRAAELTQTVRLAYRFADRSAARDVLAVGACICLHDARWYDTQPDWLVALDRHHADEIADAARYLELRDLIVRHDTHPTLVRFTGRIAVIPTPHPTDPRA